MITTYVRRSAPARLAASAGRVRGMKPSASGKRSFVRKRSRSSMTTGRHPRAAPKRTTGMASWPAPQTSSLGEGSSTSTKAVTTPRAASGPTSRSCLIDTPRASASEAAVAAASSASGLPRVFSRRPSGWTRSRLPRSTPSTEDSITVTTETSRSSSSARRRSPATSTAFSAGSTNSSTAPLHPRPQPHTASSSAVRSKSTRRAFPPPMTSLASSCTSPSRQPPLMLPMSSPLSRTRRRAPGRRYVEPRTATTVASAILSPRSERVSMASRTSAISLLTAGTSGGRRRQVLRGVGLELLLAGGAAEVVRLALVLRDEPGSSDIDEHLADRVDGVHRRIDEGDRVACGGGFGSRGCGLHGSLRNRLRNDRRLPRGAELDKLCQHTHRDLLMLEATEVESCRSLHPSERLVRVVDVPQPVHDRLGPLPRGDEPDERRLGPEGLVHSQLVVLTLGGHHDEGVLTDAGELQVQAGHDQVCRRVGVRIAPVVHDDGAPPEDLRQ